MTTRINPQSLVAILAGAMLLSTSLATSGCGTVSHLRGQTGSTNTSPTIDDAANEIENARRQLSETMSTLTALVDQPPMDVRPAFERYRNAVGALERSVNSVSNEADRMQRHGQQYFDHWNSRLAEIKNEDIRARSIERQQEVSQQFSQVQQHYQRVRQQFAPLMTTLRDIQGLLSADLTPQGVAGAREFADRARSQAGEVQQTLDQLTESFGNLSGGFPPRQRATE